MLKRKKRSKHAIINKKKYYFYSIRWFDITGDAGHKTKDEMDKLPNTFAQYYKDRKADVERVLKEAGHGQDGIKELLATYNRFLEKEKNNQPHLCFKTG